MKQVSLSESELRRRRAWLARLAEEHPGQSATDPDLPAEIRAAFSLSEEAGAAFYGSLSDEDLLDVLRRRAEELGRSPAQKEIYWVWRAYLRQRFGKWPYALTAAGLSKSAGSGGKSLSRQEEERRQRAALLSEVRRAAAELGRVPYPKDLPQVCEGLRREYATWADVLAAAGVERVRTVHPVTDLDARCRAMLEMLKAQAVELGRAPLRSEVDETLRGTLVNRCGSWRNVLYQIGLEPVVHISPFSGAALDRSPGRTRPHSTALYDCYYRLLSPGPDTRRNLTLVEELARSLGRPPKRGEVPAQVRRQLQDACGSWANALYQLGLHTEPQGAGAPVQK